MSTEEPLPKRSFAIAKWMLSLLIGVLWGLGGGAVLVMATQGRRFEPSDTVLVVVAVVIAIVGWAFNVRTHRVGARNRLPARFLWSLLIVLPLGGLAFNGTLDDCDSCGTSRPLQVPDVYGLYILYGLSLLGFAVHRRRPRPLPAAAEAAVVGSMLSGVVLCVALALQFNGLVIMFWVVPFGLPLLAPYISGGALLVAVVKRLSAQAPRSIAQRSLAVMMALPILGGWALLQKLIYSTYFGAFTQVCEGLFAQRTAPPKDCHYLCTVAARGHRWLVRPVRVGRRRGRPILVNRQLMIANAFEDLLHERWPDVGRWARSSYDRWARPICRHLRSPWISDLLYLGMKPLEWGFYLFLLFADPEDPERRLGRMYER